MVEPKISVAIMKGAAIDFELHGDFLCSKNNKSCNGKFSAKIEGNKIIVKKGENFIESQDTVEFNPGDFHADSFLLKGVTIGIDFHWEQKENQRFLGALKFLVEDEKLVAVNVVPVEFYLTSVISSEMSAASSYELLKAHSIISRSWLLSQIEKGKELKKSKQSYDSKIENENELIRWYDREDHNLYDVCADDHCQRYQGVTKLHAHNAQSAVAFTRGYVLKYEGKICDTRFSKSCGGITETFENVWEPVEHPYLKNISDYKFEPDGYETDFSVEKNAETWIKRKPHAFCNTQDEKVLQQVLLEYDQHTTDFYRWRVEYSQEEISDLINSKSGIDFGSILDLIPVERGTSARLIKLKIVGTKKTLTIGKELEIRRILSKSHLYSSAFVVEKSDVVKEIPGKFTLIGAGWGHGVGLCQIGAAVMGEMGYNFDEILLHYFAGASIEKLYK